MDKISLIYLINLNRRPDRYEHFIKQCDELNINFSKIKRFNAIDGKIYKFTDDVNELFINIDYKNEHYVKNIMGNQLSHYYILKDMIKNNYKYIIIFQDDIVLRKDFIQQLNSLLNNIPYNAEIVNIAFHKFASYSQFIPWDLNQKIEDNNMIKKKINKDICVLNNTVNPCSLGYIVTILGAVKLIEHFDKVGFLRATDWNYNDYLVNKQIFYGSNIVLGTGNPSLGTDIF